MEKGIDFFSEGACLYSIPGAESPCPLLDLNFASTRFMFYQRCIRAAFLNFHFGSMLKGPVFGKPSFGKMSRFPRIPEVKLMPLSIDSQKNSHFCFLPLSEVLTIISHGVPGEED